ALESLVKLVDRDQTGGMGQGAERAGLVNTDVVFGTTPGSTRAFRCGAGHQLIVLLDIRDVKQLLYNCETNASGFDLATSGPASDAPGPGAQFVRRRHRPRRTDAAGVRRRKRAMVDQRASPLRGVSRPGPGAACRAPRRRSALPDPRSRNGAVAGRVLARARPPAPAVGDRCARPRPVG